MHQEPSSHRVSCEPQLSPQLREFIERILLPLLVVRYCASERAGQAYALGGAQDDECLDPPLAA